jgi:hypothetical protein
MNARAALHRFLVESVALFNRNPWTHEQLVWVHRSERRLFHGDGLLTRHAHPFLDDPDFQRAYARAVEAAGWDYNIPWRAHTILWAAAVAAELDGAFVECGTGRGFMASAICEHQKWSDRPFYLLDTFLPTLQDGPDIGEPSPHYATDPEAVAENFSEWAGIQLVVGAIPASLSDVPAEPVAFLHVDLNSAEAEAHAVRHFWPLLNDGGVMVFDDYGFEGFESSRKNVDRLARELAFEVLVLPTGQAVVIKH